MDLTILLHFVANFFAGAFLCNCIPHLAAGLRGELFPSPFASPPGKGDSAPWVNVLWGTFNLIVAFLLIAYARIPLGVYTQGVLFILGFLLMGLHLAVHFGAVRNGKR